MLWQKIKSIWSRLHWNRLYIYYGYTLLNLIFTVLAGFKMVFSPNLWYLFYFILPIGFGVLAYFIFTHWLHYLRIFFISVIFLGFFSLLYLLDTLPEPWNSILIIGFCGLNVIGLCYQYFDRTRYTSKQQTTSTVDLGFSTKPNNPDISS